LYEQRLVALADVAVYVGGRQAQRSRKMGAITVVDCRCLNDATVPPPLHRALYRLALWITTAGLPLVKEKLARFRFQLTVSANLWR
jgi:hypothetical protein